MKQKYLLATAYIFLFTLIQKIDGRSVHRPPDPLIPKIITRWVDETTTYYLEDSHLEEGSLLKTFNKQHFYKNMLPEGAISCRNQIDKAISGKILSQQAQHLIEEILANKKKYRYFTLLKDRDYNSKNRSGCLILKYNDYPFVLKIFIENPQGFTQPFSKGFQPMCFFNLGGAMRHTTGFTRIANIKAMAQRTTQDPYWSTIVEFPRKWFWEPKNNRWFEVKTINIGNQKESITELPSSYGIICDAIEAVETPSLLDRRHRKKCMALAQFLDYSVDPHLKNFLIERGTGKLVVIDTEHFPTLVGLKREMRSKTYSAWYLKLSGKFITDALLRNKKRRREIQQIHVNAFPLHYD